MISVSCLQCSREAFFYDNIIRPCSHCGGLVEVIHSSEKEHVEAAAVKAQRLSRITRALDAAYAKRNELISKYININAMPAHERVTYDATTEAINYFQEAQLVIETLDGWLNDYAPIVKGKEGISYAG